MVNSHWRHDPFLQERIVQELNVPATPGNRRTMTVWELFTLQAEMTRAPYLFSCLGSMHCSCWTPPACVKSTVGLSRSLLELGGDSVLSSCHSHTRGDLLQVSRLNASEEQVLRRAWVTPRQFCVV